MRSLTLMVLIAAAAVSTSVFAQEDKPWQARADVVEKASKRKGFNYREENVPDYKLPDPLMATDGSKIGKDEWPERRSELLEIFRDQVYGRRPTDRYSVSFHVEEEIKDAFDGKATGQELTATIALGTRQFQYRFVLFIPNGPSDATYPAVIHINNRYFVPLKKAVSENDPFWPVETFIQRGYATASFHTSDVDPDKKDGYESGKPVDPTPAALQAAGIRAFFANGKPPADKAWRSLSAWGWAASRVLDHLETLPQIDADRVAVSGHSRGGKTSLWAACEDTRFAIAYSNNSGCGGAALSRRAYGETVKRITSSFPHWFCRPFAEYGDKESELPVDQHEVISLLAPRGVYAASADEDLWADPRGEYLSLIEAAPVFQLLGKSSITTRTMPALNMPRVQGVTGYHVRTGGHGLGEQDWNWFMDYADHLWSLGSSSDK